MFKIKVSYDSRNYEFLEPSLEVILDTPLVCAQTSKLITDISY